MKFFDKVKDGVVVILCCILSLIIIAVSIALIAMFLFGIPIIFSVLIYYVDDFAIKQSLILLALSSFLCITTIINISMGSQLIKQGHDIKAYLMTSSIVLGVVVCFVAVNVVI